MLTGETVGFIGLGLMGRPMARNLHRAGAALVIHNRSREVVEALAEEGMRAAVSPRAVVLAAPVVILMLTDTAAVDTVLHDDEGLLAGLQPGALVIDMGTTAVEATRRFGQEIAEAGGTFVDAPVSGGQLGAEGGTLTVMVGGSEASVAQARPLLEPLAARVTRVGDLGAGQVAKTANQMIVGITIAAVAEALFLAGRAGVDPAGVREALTGGFADSRILDVHGQRMIAGDFAPGGRATTQQKDLREALELAASLEVPLPATRTSLELYDRLVAQGDGGLDQSGLYRVYDAGAGLAS
jgi:3-hydroxyisobutyrate dehydrogenase-like beta-hydroxyacid dehydrogenase